MLSRKYRRNTKRAREKYQNYSKEEKSRNMVMNVTNEKKRLVIKNNDLESSFEKTILKP